MAGRGSKAWNTIGNLARKANAVWKYCLIWDWVIEGVSHIKLPLKRSG